MVASDSVPQSSSSNIRGCFSIQRKISESSSLNGSDLRGQWRSGGIHARNSLPIVVVEVEDLVEASLNITSDDHW